MRIGLYGGSFSPPHIGHVRAAETFLLERGLDELHVMPTAQSPHKVQVLGATEADRLAMCRLAFAHLPQVTVSDHEIARGGKSYTVLTLREYRERYGREAEIEMLVGTDMFLSLDQWFCYEEILSLARIVCMRREDEPHGLEAIMAASERYRALGADSVLVTNTVTEISSSDIRSALARGERPEMLQDGVLDYIREKGLYGDAGA